MPKATKTRKPSAADRTVDMFTGQTPVEMAANPNGDLDESVEHGSPRIEDNCDRYRDRAFECQEAVSKCFGQATDQGVYRLTTKNGWMFLEQFRLGKTGVAFHWSGVMFPAADLHELTNVFVRMCKKTQETQEAS